MQPSDNSTEEEHDLEKYKAICKFTSEDPGQVSFPEGAIITIVDKDDDGMSMIINLSIVHLPLSLPFSL